MLFCDMDSLASVRAAVSTISAFRMKCNAGADDAHANCRVARPALVSGNGAGGTRDPIGRQQDFRRSPRALRYAFASAACSLAWPREARHRAGGADNTLDRSPPTKCCASRCAGRAALFQQGNLATEHVRLSIEMATTSPSFSTFKLDTPNDLRNSILDLQSNKIDLGFPSIQRRSGRWSLTLPDRLPATPSAPC